MNRNVRWLRAVLLPVFLGLVVLPGCSGGGQVLKGTGSSFDQPIFNEWFAVFKKTHPNTTLSYSAGGSGKGIADFTGGITDFGASDAAMTDEQIEKVADKNVLLVPITAGQVVVIFNPGALKDKELKLSRKALAGIFMSKITRWNDPAIKDSNPGLDLPDKPISVVVRSDASGTTYAFTNHLQASNEEFKKEIGYGTDVKWPQDAKNRTAQTQNAGVAKQVAANEGSIGYVEYAYAAENKLPMAVLENKAGKYVGATPESGSAALGSAKLPENMRLFLPDPDGAASYPIVTYSWMLVKKDYKDEARAKTMKELLAYCLSAEGQKLAASKGYIPLPEETTAEILKQVHTIKP
jgi:phosphate transport system substrate-binding protein